MSEALDALEHRLLAGYRHQAVCYERVLAILDASERDRQGATNEELWAQRIPETLQTVANLDAQMAEDKAAWQQSGRSADRELRSLLERVAELIQMLSTRVDGHIAELMARKQRLVPEIDEFVRQRWMLNAYEQFGQTAKI